MVRVPALCTEVIWLEVLTEPIATGPFRVLSDGEHQTSTAYSTLGSATLMNRHFAYFGVIPHDGRVSRQICAAHFMPFSTAYDCCTFHVKFLSTITPKYFVFSDGSMVLCGSYRAGLSAVFRLCTKFIRASFEYSSVELCVLD